VHACHERAGRSYLARCAAVAGVHATFYLGGAESLRRAALCHGCDHPGLTNAFLVRTKDPLVRPKRIYSPFTLFKSARFIRSLPFTY